MKEAAIVLIAFALVLGGTALAVDVFHDRELTVSPPDAVAEGFVRGVITGRYTRAKEYLAEPDSRSEDELRRLDEQLGEASEIEAELVSRDDEQALVTVRVSSKDASEAVSYGLVFEREWKIE